MKQDNKNITEIKEDENTPKPTTEHFALEILKDEQRRSKAKDLGIIALGITTAISIAAIVIVTIYLTHLNHQNDREWRELFSSYDYISQDGEGINNVNSGDQGDLNNEPDAE